MRVCIISRGDLSLFPPTQGASNKLYYTLKTLSETGIKVFFVTAEDEFYYEVKRGKFRIKKYPPQLKNSKISENEKELLNFLGIPSDIHPIYHPLLNTRLWARLLYVVKKEKIDVIQAEFTCFGIPAIFVKFLTGIPVCIVEHNVETFQIPKIVKLNKNGINLIKNIEKFVCNFSDKVIVITEEEKKRLISIGVKKEKIVVIPFGVDLKIFDVNEEDVRKIRKKFNLKYPTFVFHGTYSYKPNKDAIEFLIKKVLPFFRKKKIKPKILAIGEYPPLHLKDPDVIFTGVVKNLPLYLKAADIALVPIIAGGGMRIKILEYFASKIPTISTSFAIEGIPVKNKKEVIITELKNFPKEVEKLVRNKKLQKKLKENAYSFIKKWEWKEIIKKYIEIYENLVLKRGKK